MTRRITAAEQGLECVHEMEEHLLELTFLPNEEDRANVRAIHKRLYRLSDILQKQVDETAARRSRRERD